MRTAFYVTGLGLLALTASLADAAQPQVKFTSHRLTPTTVRAGASVLASVKTKPTGGASVSSVSLRFVGTGQVYPVYTMESGPGGSWTKRFTAPVNYGKSNLSLAVWADAQTSVGIRSVKIGQLK